MYDSGVAYVGGPINMSAISGIDMAASFQLGMGTGNYLVQEHNEVNDYRKDGKTLLGYGYLKTA